MHKQKSVLKRMSIETECLVSHAYCEKTKILEIEFNSGYQSVYRYFNVPKNIANKLLEPINGQFFNHHVRGKYLFERIMIKD